MNGFYGDAHYEKHYQKSNEILDLVEENPLMIYAARLYPQQ